MLRLSCRSLCSQLTHSALAVYRYCRSRCRWLNAGRGRSRCRWTECRSWSLAVSLNRAQVVVARGVTEPSAGRGRSRCRWTKRRLWSLAVLSGSTRKSVNSGSVVSLRLVPSRVFAVSRGPNRRVRALPVRPFSMCRMELPLCLSCSARRASRYLRGDEVAISRRPAGSSQLPSSSSRNRIFFSMTPGCRPFLEQSSRMGETASSAVIDLLEISGSGPSMVTLCLRRSLHVLTQHDCQRDSAESPEESNARTASTEWTWGAHVTDVSFVISDLKNPWSPCFRKIRRNLDCWPQKPGFQPTVHRDELQHAASSLRTIKKI